jgi:hypothetical protein
MNKVRFLFALICAAFVLSSHQVQAQTVIQALTFRLIGEYQTNVVGTNVANTQTNIHEFTPTILITSANVVRALAVEIGGLEWTNWGSSYLVLERNLATGAEGIYLRTNGVQTNVSQYFGYCFNDNFTANLTNFFPGVNNFTGVTNSITTNDITATYSTNYIPPVELDRGWVYQRTDTNTSVLGAHYGVHFISLNTKNLQFNLVGTSYGLRTNVSGRYDGATYSEPILGETITSSGIFSLNTTTNIQGTGANPPVYLGGPIHGVLTVDQPYFYPIPGP